MDMANWDFITLYRYTTFHLTISYIEIGYISISVLLVPFNVECLYMEKNKRGSTMQDYWESGDFSLSVCLYVCVCACICVRTCVCVHTYVCVCECCWGLLLTYIDFSR